ncbi:hypothetical protein [Pseudocolwellia sp. HL-MZ7]|uniref:hypothetical protein n=1 Tax=Pseudocolwellia sp. HL-MZ7 TaxID=3400627 RepID=UPI003CEB4415
MRLMLIVLSIFYNSSSFANKDTGVYIQSDGSLFGLPESYSPAFLDLKSLTLQIADKRLVLPECLYKYFGENGKFTYSIDISASWYHDQTRLPPYLSITLTPDEENIEYTIMFNMNTLKIIKGYSLPKERNAQGVSYMLEPLGFTSECLSSIKVGSVK